MRFIVGYQMTELGRFTDEIIRMHDKIHEVYFSWAGVCNARNSLPLASGMTETETQLIQLEDLKRISAAGIPLNILYNANCFGGESQSRAFFERVGAVTEFLQRQIGLNSMTTTSPLIAKFFKDNFSDITVRASVNVGVGSSREMDYLTDLFDGFYMKREFNRDFNKIRELAEWCEKNGKELFALANSGCFNYCPARTFHDNLVAHEREIAAMDNGYEFYGICRQYLKKKENRNCILSETSFIRPEDISLYEGLFSAMKLATRVNPNPCAILKAYVDGCYDGGITDLLEPSVSGDIRPYILDNRKVVAEISEERLNYTNYENAMIELESFIC